ncbi:VCBS repeat-containing protein [Ramlibacter sp. AW1]|uniref:VCBS repeat-containing protein n=1 Tax=Ramlibacter aurantiacus TaxID=2801330 RepID=A0A936ZR41_9BURK|nr:FG-GAP-like repeat-containing protein [Ramlibacter aurantiacus]MBL0419144.1 VCBS repeat-containing protein [Ramlibacter aurantiacus]
MPALVGMLLAATARSAPALEVTRGQMAREVCTAAASVPSAPADAVQPVPLPDTVPAIGEHDIRIAWLAGPDSRYSHAALGNDIHAASLHATVRGTREVVNLVLPQDRVFEDRIPRLVDLDGDGRDEVVVVESRAGRGASLVAYGIERSGHAAAWVERARSDPVGSMRWLNPIGAADFDGDGRLELASVTTPHIGGVLTLYRYAPPRLEVLGRTEGVSNHRFGSPEQRLSALLARPDGPVVVVPDQAFSRLLFHGWARGAWRPAAPALPLPGKVERVLGLDETVCVELAGGDWLRITAP